MQIVVHVARWDKAAWSSVGALADVSAAQFVEHDLGAGTRLFGAGSKTSTGKGAVFSSDGAQWTQLGPDFHNSWFDDSGLSLWTIGVFDLRLGPKLLVGGEFSTRSYSSSAAAGWDGASWSDFGGGLTSSTSARAVAAALTFVDFGTGRGADLFVDGTFDLAAGTPSSNVARWTSCGGNANTFCYGDGSAAACPCGNDRASADRAGCAPSFGEGGRWRAVGRAPLSGDSLVLAGSGMPSSSALCFQGAGLANGGADVTFGDGIKCTVGPFIRLGTKGNVSSVSQYPASTDSSVSVRGLIGAPGVRHDQVRYRNAATFCTSETFNTTDGLTVIWQI